MRFDISPISLHQRHSLGTLAQRRAAPREELVQKGKLEVRFGSRWSTSGGGGLYLTLEFGGTLLSQYIRTTLAIPMLTAHVRTLPLKAKGAANRKQVHRTGALIFNKL